MTQFRLLLAFCLTLLAIPAARALEEGQTVRLVHGDLSIMTENSALDENKNAVLWTETNVNSQRWTLFAKTNGTFLLQNDYTNYYLGGLSSGNSGAVGQVSKSAANTKGSWEFVPVEGTTDQFIVYQGTTRRYALATAEDATGGSKLSIVNTQNASIDPARITWTVEVVEQMEKAFTKDKRDDMMEKWKARCYKKASTGWVIGNGGWWGDAEMFEIVLDALETTGDQQYATMFDNLYTNFIARNKETWYQQGVSGYNEYNDDIAWMCIACVRAYLLTGNAKYRTTAKKNFDGMFKRADCYGNDLLQWKHGSGKGTNSCINGPASVCACYLAIAQADTSYFGKARKTYMAERGKLFEMSGGKPTGKVWDSYDQSSGNYNYWASTYNQGTCLGAAILLYKHYGEQMFKDDADAIIKWSEANMANSKGIIHVCQTVSGDLCGFKGIMLRYLRLYAETFNDTKHYAWIAKNAYHAWNNRNSKGITSSAWLTKAEEDFRHKEGEDYKNFGNEGNMTCVSAAFNCHLGAVEEHDAYAKNEAEDFNYVQNAQVTYSGNKDEDDGGMVGPMKNKHYIGYRRVDFGDKPASHLDVRANITLGSTAINVFLDYPTTKEGGILLCSIKGSELAGTRTWDTLRKMINQPVTGVHDVYFVSSGNGQTSFNWWQFHSLSPVYADLTNGGGTLSCSFAETNSLALTDGNITTACNAPIEEGSETWIQYQCSSPMRIYGYQFFSGDDSNGDPKGWALQASDDGKNWETLHTVADTTFSVRGQRYSAEIETEKAYNRYRLLFDLDETQTMLSVSEWQLLGRCIEQNDLTADGGKMESLTPTDNLDALNDHVGETPFPTPFSVQYNPLGYYMLHAYSITIDEASKAPTTWKLEGSANGSTWKLIDQQTDVSFPYDNYTAVFNVNPGTGYLCYRLTMNEENAQITQWQLFGKPDYGTFFADITTISSITASQGDNAEALLDKNGATYSTIGGTAPYWDITTPIPARAIALSLLSADNVALDPQNITLYGIDQDGVQTQIANKALTFPARGSRITFTTTTSKLFKQFRLQVNEAASESVRLADVELYSTAIAEKEDACLIVPINIEASAPELTSTEHIGRINDQSRSTCYHAAFDAPVSITCLCGDTASINSNPINVYSITASKNEPTRDPSAWILEGSNDNVNWTTLDSRTGQSFSHRYATQFYLIDNPEPYAFYRLTVNATNGGNQLQIGELQLLSIQPSATGIIDLKDTKDLKDSKDAIYNLAGQKMADGKLPRGIYIIGGKKILVK